MGIRCAFGNTLVGMLGTNGDRDPVCIGDATIAGRRSQLAVLGNCMGITEKMQDAITDKDIAGQFTWNKTNSCYQADGVTYVTVAEAADASAYSIAQGAG